MKKINEKPFELFGLKYEDYSKWCENNHKDEKDVNNKKKFFEKVRHYEIFKKNGTLIEISKEDN